MKDWAKHHKQNESIRAAILQIPLRLGLEKIFDRRCKGIGEIAVDDSLTLPERQEREAVFPEGRLQ